jgi:hypothetical protein
VISVIRRFLLPLALLAAPGLAHADEPTRSLDVDAQLFGGYLRTDSDDVATDAYDLGRAELGTRGDWNGRAGFELRLEAVRSATPQSLFGIDGNSLVVRVKRAWGRVDIPLCPLTLELRGGLVPDAWIEASEAGYALRPVSPLLAERGAFFDTSDLGFAAVLDWRGRATLQLSTTNGEGRRQVEQNDGKNTTLVASGVPWVGELPYFGAAALRVAVGARDGSRGLQSAKDRRLAFAASLTGPRVDVGAELVLADGYEGQGSRDARGVAGWLSAGVWERWIGVYGRVDSWTADVDSEDADDRSGARTLVSAGVWSDPVPPGWLGAGEAGLRVFLGVQRESAGDDAGPFPGVPEASEATRVMFIVSTQGSWRLVGRAGPEESP